MCEFCTASVLLSEQLGWSPHCSQFLSTLDNPLPHFFSSERIIGLRVAGSPRLVLRSTFLGKLPDSNIVNPLYCCPNSSAVNSRASSHPPDGKLQPPRSHRLRPNSTWTATRRPHASGSSR